MSNLHKYSVVLLSAVSLLGACKKQLNVFPTTAEVDGNMIFDTKSASTALNGVYYQLAAGGADVNGIPSTTWYEVNEEIPSQLSGMLSYTFGGGGLDEHTYNAKTPGIGTKWSYGYGLVNAANGFLKNLAPVTAITSADKSRMTAEAKFLRAYGNTELLLYYGQFNDVTSPDGIILRSEFVRPDNVFLPRSSVAASYDSIVSDLDAAIPNLPSANSSVAYATSWAAKLLKARVLINRGSAPDLTQVISLTKDIIANGPYALETSVKDVFWTKGLASKEVILGIQPFPKQNIRWMSYVYYDDYSPNDFMTSLFQGDPRADWQIQTVANPYGPDVALTKFYPGSISTISAAAISENSYAMRLTEAYLLQAEAITVSGGSLADAKALLKTVEGHAGITDFTAVDAAATVDALRLLIIEEEMKNFVGEAGQDWLAVRRLPLATIQGLLPSITSKSLLLLPIPDAEVTANNKMKQNPNY